MNPTETFPHRADPGTHAPRSWGENCPAALREALEEERARPAGPEAGEPPRHLVIALSQMQRAFESRDRRAFGTINEYLQPVADAALAWIREAESATPGPHITPALMRRVEALGFVPGSGEPVGWLVGYVEGLVALLTTTQEERDELAATLANERATSPSATELLTRARDAFAASGNGFVSIFSADEHWFAAVVQVRDRRHAAALLRWRGGSAS